MTNNALKAMIGNDILSDTTNKPVVILHLDNGIKYIFNYNVNNSKGSTRPKLSDLKFTSYGGEDAIEFERIDDNTNNTYTLKFLTDFVQGVTIIPNGSNIDPNIVRW